MKEIIKLLIEYQKQKRQTQKDLRRLAACELDYEALQRMVNAVVVGETEVEIVINLQNGRTITIRRVHKENDNKSFRERFIEARSNKLI